MGSRYKRFDDPEITGDDTNDILAMCIESLDGRKAKYPDNEKGLEDFKNMSLDFFRYCQRVNNDEQNNRRIIPDVEAWVTYLGITRQAVHKYYSGRGDEWREAIDKIKTAILSIKKQLMLTGKIPSIVGIFDLSNNHGYVNTTEFKLKPPVEERKTLTAADLPQLGSANKGCITKQPLPILKNDE